MGSLSECRTEFQLEVVKSFLEGEGAAKLLARGYLADPA